MCAAHLLMDIVVLAPRSGPPWKTPLKCSHILTVLCNSAIKVKHFPIISRWTWLCHGSESTHHVIPLANYSDHLLKEGPTCKAHLRDTLKKKPNSLQTIFELPSQWVFGDCVMGQRLLQHTIYARGFEVWLVGSFIRVIERQPI